MKNKKILFIIIPIVVVLMIAAILITLYLTTDMFKNSNVLFAKYFAQNEEILKMIQNENTEEQKNFKMNNTYTMDGDLTTTIQDGTNIQELKMKTTGRHDASTERTYSEMILKNGEADTLKVSYINSGDVYALKCDDIMPNYIGIRNNELKKFAQNMGVNETDIPNIPDNIDFNVINDILKITDEQKQHIINTYSKVISESITADKYKKVGKTQISVDGTGYETNAYQVTIDGTTLKQIILNCLNTLQNDNATLVMISDKLSTMGLPNEYTDITKISEAIGNGITQIQNETSSDINVIITIYENKGKTLRTEITTNITDTENIESMDNTEIQDTAIVSSTTTSNASKIVIDKLGTENTAKAILTIEQSQIRAAQNEITGELNATEPTTSMSQVILQKTTTDTSTTTETTIIPDTNNTAQSMTMSTTMGKIINGTINNSSDSTINISPDGINVQTIQSSYIQNIQTATEIEEIMELKNSNTVIVNNYSKEQLLPFLTQVGQKIEQVIPDKLGQLGIDVNANQNSGMNASNITNISNNIMKIVQMVGLSGINVANVNGVNIEGIVVAVASRLYSQAIKIVDKAQQAEKYYENAQKKEKEAMNQLMEDYNNILGN